MPRKGFLVNTKLAPWHNKPQRTMHYRAVTPGMTKSDYETDFMWYSHRDTLLGFACIRPAFDRFERYFTLVS